MMRRRDFLRATLVTAGAVVVPACSDESDVGGACTVEAGEAFFPQSVASGDPRHDSVVLWTRVADPNLTEDTSITLVVARDEAFTQIVTLGGGAQKVLSALKDNDHCVKVKVTELEPETTYYYRFFYTTNGGCYGSRVGRTRTAPASDKDATVRFAFVSCQDYTGRYYNTYAALAKQELDFFVHLGDYVYETTGDPRFQTVVDDRKVTFTDEAGAVPLSAAGKPYFAAKTLGNYRELYQKYRSDAALQRVHELFPMIAIWDDHEFSDDCHGATACYLDGKSDETDVSRRKAANQAWFEYMPVDYETADFKYDPSAEYPQDITIYREFQFGKHVHLVMTDLRTYRADHLIPEDAFPGAVVATQDELLRELGDVPSFASPYCDMDSFPGRDYKDLLVQAAPALGFDPKNVTGLVSATFINLMVAEINKTVMPAVEPISAENLAVMDRGFAYLDLGKSGFYTSIGSRYMVVKDTFDPVSRLKYAETSGASGAVMGEQQEQWFLDKMSQSTSTWKVWGNEYCLVQLAIDLRQQLAVPEAYRRRFYMNCDAWDGFRDRRSALIEQLAAVGNVVAITGDIHAFYAGTPMANDDPTKKLVEFVGSSISTSSYRSLLLSQIQNDPQLSQISTAPLLAQTIDSLLVDPETKVNPHLGFGNSGDNGFCVAEVDGQEFVVSMMQLPEAEVATNQYEQPDAILGKMKVDRFKTVAGGSDLYWEKDGAWKKWDPNDAAWV
jgi:alkaline phosphatase D